LNRKEYKNINHALPAFSKILWQERVNRFGYKSGASSLFGGKKNAKGGGVIAAHKAPE
jgi:hypothetical protein